MNSSVGAAGWRHKLIGSVEPLTRLSAFLGFCGLLLIAFATLADVLMRWLFNSPIHGVDEVSGLAFAVVIVACFPMVLLSGENITIRFLGMALGRRATYWLEALGALMTLVFFVLLAWQYVILSMETYSSGDTTMTVGVIKWPWWTATTAIVFICVPVQLAVVFGHLVRAMTGEGPGGTVETEQPHAV
jgi:TRAP-type transport system small permease protein